jgi:hypothetical protein
MSEVIAENCLNKGCCKTCESVRFYCERCFSERCIVDIYLDPHVHDGHGNSDVFCGECDKTIGVLNVEKLPKEKFNKKENL